MIVLQSPATILRPCPLGTSENSQQHARVIYGWVQRPKTTQSPEGTAEILTSCSSRILSFCPNLRAVSSVTGKNPDFAQRTQFSTQVTFNQNDACNDNLPVKAAYAFRGILPGCGLSQIRQPRFPVKCGQAGSSAV